MNWDAIGVVAEVVGAVAVVVTLAYLAIETRLSREASQAGLTYSSVELYSRWRNSLLQNSDVAKAVAKANRGEEIDDEERFQIAALMDEIFIASCASYESVVRATALHERALEVEYLLAFLNDNPGLVSEWNRFRPLAEFVSAEFAKALDTKLGIVREVASLKAPPNKSVESDT